METQPDTIAAEQEAQAVAADLAYNRAKMSGDLLRREIERATRDEAPWIEATFGA